MARIVFAGHSVVKGTDYGGVTRTDTFAYKVGRGAGYADADIYIKGVGGDTSGGLKARIQTDVVALAPDVCGLMIGANDWSTGITLSVFKENLRSITKTILDAGIKLVLYTDNMNRGSTADFVSLNTYEDVIRSVAAEFDVPLIDLFSRMCTYAMCNSYVQYYAGATEKIHLSIAGHDMVAQMSLQSSPKSMFVQKVVPPTPDPPTEDSSVSSLCLAIADYLCTGQTSDGLQKISDIRSAITV